MHAQEPPAEPPPKQVRVGVLPDEKPSSHTNVRVDVTIRLEADGKPLTKALSMVTGDGKSALGRAGIEIPVPTQIMGAPGTAPITSYNYRPLSVNVDAIPQILDATRVLLRLKLNFSTVYKPAAGQVTQPSFGNASHDAHGIVLESGKPVVVTQSTDAETGRDYTVEVKATILK
jgi:hypothetical protein